MKVNFDEKTHTYTTDKGVVLQSVTQVLSLAGLVDSTWFTEEGRIRGVAVHKACELLARRTLDRSSVCDAIKGYLDAFERFMAESGFKVTKSEKMVVNAKKGYAGRYDFLGILNGRKAVLDIKSGSMPSWTAEQTAGYAECLGYPARFGLELRENGTYSLKEFADPQDFANWNACLIIAGLKKKRGLNE